MLAFERLAARANAYGYLPLTGDPTMAKPIKLAKVKEFTYAKAGGGGTSKYPWGEWFAPKVDNDGKKVHADGTSTLLLIERSDVDKDGNLTGDKRDYEVDTNAMVPKLKTAARRRYKVVQVSRRDADGNRLTEALIIRARDMNDGERQIEDILRAEEKAAKKAAKSTATDPSTVPMTATA